VNGDKVANCRRHVVDSAPRCEVMTPNKPGPPLVDGDRSRMGRHPVSAFDELRGRADLLVQPSAQGLGLVQEIDDPLASTCVDGGQLCGCRKEFSSQVECVGEAG